MASVVSPSRCCNPDSPAARLPLLGQEPSLRQPSPARVLICPGTITLREPVPIAERYCVAITWPSSATNTIAPRRRPGYLGAKLTDTTQGAATIYVPGVQVFVT